MSEYDWKKELKYLYSPGKNIGIVKVPKMCYIMINGAGDPNTNPIFQNAIEVLYGLSYTIRFSLKNSGRQAYPVPPLEGLFWADDMSVFMEHPEDKSTWAWTLMISQPIFVTKEDFEKALESIVKKKKDERYREARFEEFEEGDSVQVLYTGPYSGEGPTILEMHKYIENHGWKLSGKHHEIYMSDARRVTSDKLKTVIRQPFTK